MTDRLYIENREVDLPAGTIVTITKQINSFFEVKDRQTSFTNNFTLPFTPINKSIMDNLGIIGNQSDKPYIIAKAKFFRHGTPLIIDGKATIKAFDYNKGYQVNIQEGNHSLFDELGSKKLSDLDFNHAHKLNISEYFNRLNATDGIVYPIADYGNLSHIKIEYQMPCFYIKDLWNKIFTEAGYTYSYYGADDIFQNDFFNELVITGDKGLETTSVSISNFFDNFTQKDFIKSVNQLFGLVFQKERGTKNYEFILIEEMLNNRTDALDWSDKLSKLKKQTYRIGSYARTNYFKYTYENDQDNFNDGTLRVENETLSPDKTLFTSKFGSPKKVRTSINRNSLLSMSFYADDKVNSLKPFLMRVKKIDITDFDFSYKGTEVKQTTNEGLIATTTGLNFNNLIGKYYLSFGLTINRPLVVDAELVLRNDDIYNLDFFRQVYLKQLGGYFYINKISGYKAGKLTKVQLIRTRNKADTIGEYNDDFNNDFLI